MQSIRKKPSTTGGLFLMKRLTMTGLKKFDVNIKGVYYILKEA
ncbi:hypothetical protein HMPREF0322_04376 [Desulfitobacterium hafniense DP7]|uniref:Uncharacterized protein n=1 Tax=Desulfitobacterium hafniense DP7 TaxID=537010 RepID=G9XTR9_DESHA|nr:hypothetical protein HMPREF0322_04376 [Desulfitobacterium hafniense DP7]